MRKKKSCRMFHVKHFGAAICGRRGIGRDVSRETILGQREGRGMKILTARPHRLLAACVDRLGEATARGEGCMFLVPPQYTLQAELEIMERLHVSGSFLIDVLSPKRLQSRVFELAGMPKQTRRPILTVLTSSRILKRLAFSSSSERVRMARKYLSFSIFLTIPSIS